MAPSPLPGGAAARARTIRLAGAAMLLLGLLLLVLGPAAAAEAVTAPEGARVDVVELDGLLDPRLVAHLEDVVATAGRERAALVAVTLDSPGALRVDADRLVRIVEESDVPVLVWVGPQGARATGGAAVLAHAAHILAVAPGTLVGMADPVDVARPDADRNQLAALLSDLAEERGRDRATVEELAMRDAALVVVPDGFEEAGNRLARSETETGSALGQTEAVARGAVDVVAGTLTDVLVEVAGREVTVGGSPAVLDLDPATAAVRFDNPGLVRRMLHTAANPALAYLLVVAGALCILFEVFQPGFGVAGLTGLALLAFGVYGFAVLPTSWLGAALLLAGLVLLAIDLAVAGLGPVTALGTACFGVGSWLLYAGSRHVGLPLWLVLLATLAVAAFFVVVMTVVLRAQGNQAMAGADKLVGRVAVVRSMLNPEGHVFVDGALWRARAPEEAGRVPTGTHVRIVRLDDNLTLEVDLEDAEAATDVR